MKDSIQILMGYAALAGLIYSTFRVETNIYKYIDAQNKLLTERISLLDQDFKLHVAVYLERKGTVDYLLHANDEKIEHKAKRLFDEIKEIKSQLKQNQKLDE